MIRFDIYKKIPTELEQIIRSLCETYLPLDQSGIAKKERFQHILALAKHYDVLIAWSPMFDDRRFAHA